MANLPELCKCGHKTHQAYKSLLLEIVCFLL